MQLQRNGAEVIRRLECRAYEERLKFSLEKRRLWEDLVVFKYLEGTYKKKGD